MICKTKLSSMFGDINVTNDFIESTIGKSVEVDGEEIGTITIIDLEEGLLYVDVIDYYRNRFEKLCIFEVIC